MHALPTAAQVRLHVPHVFTASVALAAAGRPCAVRVAFDAAERAAEGVAWGVSAHHVYKRISAVATRALAYFARRAAVTMMLGDTHCPPHPLASSLKPISMGGGDGGTELTAASGLPLAGVGDSVHSASTVATPFLAGALATPFTATPTALPTLVAWADGGAGGSSGGAGAGDGGKPDSLKTGGAAATGAAAGGKAVTTTVTTPDGAALEDLLLWVSAYRDVYTRPCACTGQLMALEPPMQLPLPPVFRPFM